MASSLGEREDRKWAAFEVGEMVSRQNGKGTTLEGRELTGLYVIEEERLIIHSAQQPAGCGDLRTETSGDWTWYHNAWSNYCPNSTQCWESIGITQVKDRPDGSSGAGTDPLRRLSTAFNIDYQASVVRFFYDNPSGLRSSWGDASYAPLQEWDSQCAWFSSYPYSNSTADTYCTAVQTHLTNQDWLSY